MINSQSVIDVLQPKSLGNQQNILNNSKQINNSQLSNLIDDKDIINISNLNLSNSKNKSNQLSKTSPYIDEKPKKPVPRLKLETLPNYHGKFNDCINHLFLKDKQQKSNNES